jgi:hypothetical protein
MRPHVGNVKRAWIGCLARCSDSACLSAFCHGRKGTVHVRLALPFTTQLIPEAAQSHRRVLKVDSQGTKRKVWVWADKVAAAKSGIMFTFVRFARNRIASGRSVIYAKSLQMS